MVPSEFKMQILRAMLLPVGCGGNRVQEPETRHGRLVLDTTYKKPLYVGINARDVCVIDTRIYVYETNATGCLCCSTDFADVRCGFSGLTLEGAKVTLLGLYEGHSGSCSLFIIYTPLFKSSPSANVGAGLFGVGKPLGLGNLLLLV